MNKAGRICALDGHFTVGNGVEMMMPSCAERAVYGLWTDGDAVYADTEEKANSVADVIDSLGFTAVTGLYQKDEDERDGCVDERTGWWYVEIG